MEREAIWRTGGIRFKDIERDGRRRGRTNMRKEEGAKNTREAEAKREHPVEREGILRREGEESGKYGTSQNEREE